VDKQLPEHWATAIKEVAMSEDGTQQRQEIPTHLEVEDRILFGLTLRQGVILLLGTTVGYFLFAQSGQPLAGIQIPLALRVVLGLIPVVVTLALALIQPAGRPLEDWLFAIARYVAVPKRCIWHPRIPSALADADVPGDALTLAARDDETASQSCTRKALIA
jgi:PrgI family protein